MSWAMRHVVNGERVKAKSPADVLKPGDVVYVEKKEGSAVHAAAAAGGFGRPGGDGPPHRPRSGDGGRLLLFRIRVQPRHAGLCASPAHRSSRSSTRQRSTMATRPPRWSWTGRSPSASATTVWSPKNYDGKPAGPSTLRTGIERSRNLMTVRLANDMGMKLVAEYAERFGVYDKLAPYLPMALGAGETTVMRMVSAYSVMANGGKQIKPSLIDRIQDRYGKTVFKHDERACDNCDAPELVGPARARTGRQFRAGARSDDRLPDHLDDGRRGAARHRGDRFRTRSPDRRQDRHDQRRKGRLVHRVTRPTSWSASTWATTSRRRWAKARPAAAWRRRSSRSSWDEALKDTPIVDFQVPEGMKLIAINRKTGMQASEGEPGMIMEAFKPGTGPADSYWVIGMATRLPARAARRFRRRPTRRSSRAAAAFTDQLDSKWAAASARPCCFTHYAARPYGPRRFNNSPLSSGRNRLPCAQKPRSLSMKSSRR